MLWFSMLCGMHGVRVSLLLSFLLAFHSLILAQGQTKTRLLLDHNQAAPGDTVYAAVELQMPDGWHTYWKNPSDSGDSGQPTRIEWELPPFLVAGPIEWPVPTRLREEVEMVFTLTGRAALLIPLKIATNAPSGPASIKARVRWLECQKACVQGKSELQARLIIGTTTQPSADAAAFAQYRQALPSAQAFPAGFRWIDPPTAKVRHFSISFLNSEGTWDFFPEPIVGASFGASKEGKVDRNGRVTVEKTVEIPGDRWPANMPGLLVRLGEGNRTVAAYNVSGEFNPGREAPKAEQASAGSPGKPAFLLMLAFAFLGGLILNIMPCVLPVIALKILGFVRQSHEQPGRIRSLGLAYGAGVLASFLILGGLVIAVGKNAHQGLLFQNPMFLVAMTTLMVLVALNLFGVFEVSLSGEALDSAVQLADREGLTGAFFNGVLATVLATPCTAPFLGVSIGFALAQGPQAHPGIILLFFLTAGVGLAFPYVVLCLQPRWLKLLPKPGPWMQRFKVIMGFPMLATAAWLLSLSADHYDTDGLLWLGLFLVTLALAAWIFGEFVQRSAGKRFIALLTVIGLIASAYLWMLESELNWRKSAPSTGGSRAVTRPTLGKHGLDWAPWSAASVSAAQAEGRPVLVDFTAKWCTTCQANNRIAIEVAPVIAMLKKINAATLLGDFTLEDPLIAAELRKHQRAGVPLVLVYSKDPSRLPRVLPEFLTRGTVLEALEWAANPR